MLLLLACAPSPTHDHATYQAVVAAPSGDVAADLARCATIADADLAGDCALVAAADHCDQIAPGLWRDECWFQAAEAANRRGDATAAIDACGAAGRFAPECTYHLWRQAAKVASDPDPAVALAAITPAREAWLERLGPETVWTGVTLPGECPDRQVDALFWCVFWTEEMGVVPTPDLRVCDALTQGRDGCVTGALTAVRRRAVKARGGCAAPVGEDPARALSLVPDPRFEAALRDPCAPAR